ncbi:MAG: nucleoside/nucleotide kinase family protein [Pseudonocardia sp.]|uniref:nucleoside/nucleotide kinase family protein n=1 Tax=unclassified Pseudonocardia TaxID=2619320 RepID=UPI00086BCBA0|nr:MULTISPECIES: nucleoside/nucleotide kinase family protein [unclassified Pseudonocardia]MBN9111542.1 nucleoside/nucleotide kinase family protein [Pseudonocardia sp.]ODU23966.1 MAG: nucleoside/nucleotide kinase family protein [Pseudonocardia sp. SCN 72-51]ODV02777.1 MAG: nucleoside/nucleotide kinase family protein [Pseudonocardia sp. SCN 73-27]
MRLAELAARALALAGDGTRRTLLGITGAPGAGKTTLARALVTALADVPPPGATPGEWVAHVPMDGFHLADVALHRLGRAGRKGAPDTFDAAGYAALLRRLHADDPAVTVWAPQFERDLEQPLAGVIGVAPAVRLVVTEGNYLLLDDPAWRPVADALDEVWFCAPDESARLDRLVARHVEFGKNPDHATAWVRDVDGPNAALVAATTARADLVVTDDVLAGLGPGAGQSA